MKQKIILPISLIALVGLAIFVSAATMENKGGFYEVTVHLSQGWNLIAGTVIEDGILENSDIGLNDIDAMWYYSPLQNKYIEMYPNTDWDKINQDDEDFVLTNAMWIYSKDSGNIKYSTLEDYPSLENRQLYSGWNFLTITPEIEGKSLNEVKGSCNIEKAYLWDSANQQWGTITNLLDDKNILTKEGEIGDGFIIKVSDDCALGESSGNISPPPVLP